MISALLAVVVACAEDPAARIVVRHVREPAPRVAMELHVAGDADGESSFSVPDDWAGVSSIADHLHDLAFRDGAGQPLPIERDGAVGFRVQHAPGAALTASWWLGDPQPAANGTGNDYRPRATAENFQFLGSIGLLRADALADGAPHRFAVTFEGCDGEGRAAACSFGAGPQVAVETTLDAFCHSIFIGGAARLHRRHIDGHELLFALTGRHGFADDELVELAERIIRMERDFFADRGDPRFVITLVLEPGKSPRTSMGGTGLTQSFALFLSPGYTLKPGSDDRARIAGLLAHEHLHHWNGGVVHLRDPEGHAYWFSEGFTDFFTRRLLVRSGLWSVAEWIGAWNDCFAAFAANPLREAPAAQIAAEFWSSPAASQLPYQRGAIVAALLDRELRAQGDSGGMASLDEFMRDVVARAVAGEPLDTAELLELIADATSAEFAELLRTIVVDGALPPLDLERGGDELFGPLLRLRPRPTPAANGAAVPWLERLPGSSDEELRARL